MRIACPKCAAEYEVPASDCRRARRFAALVAAVNGRRLRRPKDYPERWPPRSWKRSQTATPEAEEPLPRMTAMDRLAATGLRPTRSTRLVAAWILTLVILMAAAAATIVWREPVVRAWPPSGRVLGSAGSVCRRPLRNTRLTQRRLYLDLRENDASEFTIGLVWGLTRGNNRSNFACTSVFAPNNRYQNAQMPEPWAKIGAQGPILAHFPGHLGAIPSRWLKPKAETCFRAFRETPWKGETAWSLKRRTCLSRRRYGIP